MEQAIEGADAVRGVKRGRPAKAAAIDSTEVANPAQLYAMRVWAGQSIDVPRDERIERCINAVRGQNLPTDGLTFPA